MKNYLKENVYEATKQRLACIFSKFDHVVVAFSGGKDSGVLLEMVYHYYKACQTMYGKVFRVYVLSYLFTNFGFLWDYHVSIHLVTLGSREKRDLVESTT